MGRLQRNWPFIDSMAASVAVTLAQARAAEAAILSAIDGIGDAAHVLMATLHADIRAAASRFAALGIACAAATAVYAYAIGFRWVCC